jgi:hypothetical protein
VKRRLDGDQREVELAVELGGRADRVERDGVLGAGLLEGQARLAQPLHVLLVGVQHDDAPNLARELGRGDPADGRRSGTSWGAPMACRTTACSAAACASDHPCSSTLSTIVRRPFGPSGALA